MVNLSRNNLKDFPSFPGAVYLRELYLGDNLISNLERSKL